MKDREMLELAAKAAQYELIQFSDYSGFQILDDGDSRWWNPLEDDGDALRLAVKLDIQVKPANIGTMATLPAPIGDCAGHIEMLGDGETDRCAATRRAIVRAAAEIGLQHK